MTTFAGQMDFDGPQPFNVDIEKPEPNLYPRAGKGVLVRPQPVVRKVLVRRVPVKAPPHE